MKHSGIRAKTMSRAPAGRPDIAAADTPAIMRAPAFPRAIALAALWLGSASASVAAPPDPIPIPATPAIAQAADPTADLDKTVRSTVLTGSAPPPAAPHAAIQQVRSGDVSVNLPDADVKVVAQAVLGDILHKKYVVAQGVAGRVSLVTPKPVARASLLGLFETALRSANLALVPVAGGYEIENAANAHGVIGPETTGFGSEIITVRFINPDEVRKVLDSVLPGVVTATDVASGAITIAGTTGQRSSAREILHQFDVDWLRNTSFALYIPQRTDARLITPSLDKLINAADSPTHGLVRLITMDKLNGILAISTQPQYLTDIRRWIEVLDREGESNERRIFVYRVQNGRARDLTRTINAAYGASNASGAAGSFGANGAADPFAASDPNAAAGASQTANQPPVPARNAATPGAREGATATPGTGGFGGRVTADESNNAIIVLGTSREYAIIEEALRKLDIPPQQVLIEAAITEVGLTDDLQYGVQWNFTSGNNSVGYSEGSTSAPTQTFPGFSYFYSGSSIAATLNALQQKTNVKVVSAPKLLVLNNQTAALQVGDQVPISTGSATNLVGGTNSVVSTIEYKDTGVILKITPRVNSSGLVQLDVSQEVSQVSTARASSATQQQSPTISTRRVATTVAVRDGEVIALGGLFSDTKTLTRNGIPILSQIPVVGGLFGTRGTNDRRTELLVLLKPHVIANANDARAETEELRSKLRTLEPFKSQGRIP